MKTLPADASSSAGTLLVFVDAAGVTERWLLLGVSGVLERGESSAGIPANYSKAVLVVPGEQVAIHWLDLAEGLAQPQAAAAARLMLADASAEALADMHVAVGRAEAGLTPVALVASARMAAWLAGFPDTDRMVPSTMLLAPPPEGLARRDRGEVSDYRGSAAAFAIEPDLGDALTAGGTLRNLDQQSFETSLTSLVADLPLNLRQGPYARRRQWNLQAPRLRRTAMLAVALALLSLVVQVAAILGYTFAADRLEVEAQALAVSAPGTSTDARLGFAPPASALFEAVRATPNVELSRLDYRADGRLVATVMIDGPATLAALQSHIESAGLRVAPGEQRMAGGRPTADLTIGPA